MADLAQILSRKWLPVAGEGPYLRLDLSDEAHRPLDHSEQYVTLVWNPAYPTPKPTLAAILAFEAEVDAELAVLQKQRLARREFESTRPDAILAAIETLAEAVADLGQGKVPKKALADLDAQVKAIRAKLG
ncbi:MAG: hypothetical protein ACREIB_06510 [Pseudomonadota bacterium]